MKNIKTTIVAAKTPDENSATYWRLQYNKIKGELRRVKSKMQLMQHPQKSQEEIDRIMLDLRNFVTSMPLEQGAVTCANLYNAAFFADIYDPLLTGRICFTLVETYKLNSALIESTFALWESLQNKAL